MNLKLKFDVPFKKYLSQVVSGLSRFQIILTLLVFGAVVSGAVLSVSSHVDPAINQQEVNKRLVDLKRVEFDEEAIAQIEALRDSNVDINSQFDPNRENPFIE